VPLPLGLCATHSLDSSALRSLSPTLLRCSVRLYLTSLHLASIDARAHTHTLILILIVAGAHFVRCDSGRSSSSDESPAATAFLCGGFLAAGAGGFLACAGGFLACAGGFLAAGFGFFSNGSSCAHEERIRQLPCAHGITTHSSSGASAHHWSLP